MVRPARLTLAGQKVRVEHGYQITNTVREMVIFAPQNIIMDPPFTKMDLVSCRNLLIYLSPELQKRLLPLFHYSLNPGGVLFLGNSETIGEFTDLFKPLDDKARLYRRINSPLRTKPVKFSSEFVPGLHAPRLKASKPAANLQSLADQLLLQKYSPAAVLVSDKVDILYISGRTGKYLEPAAGKVNWNIFAMAREGLRYELNVIFKKALQQKEAVTLKNVAVRTNGETQAVDITVQAAAEPEALRGSVMIVFTDVATSLEAKVSGKAKRSSAAAVMVQMERELEQARQEARNSRDEMQTLQEEAKCANEELQSTNEELQSTNEELQTLNHELNVKVNDLSRLNNDMKNLLDSTELTTLFLDNLLNVRLFTIGSNRIFKLMRRDVGRQITDIASDLLYSELANDAREVLRTLVSHEKEVTTRDGHWFLMRIMPYRTLENMIDGVVITFVDITTSKTLEEELRKTQAGLHKQIGEQSLKTAAVPDLSKRTPN